jgi:hypothetical protein
MGRVRRLNAVLSFQIIICIDAGAPLRKAAECAVTLSD